MVPAHREESEVNSRQQSVPRKGRKVHVSAGEDYAEFRREAIGAFRQTQRSDDSGLEQRSNGHGAGRFNDDFHALPDEARCRDDLLLADEEDAVHVAAEDRERPWRKRGTSCDCSVPVVRER